MSNNCDNNRFTTSADQNEVNNRLKIEEIIGKENLDGILDDIIGSSQNMVDDVYAEKPLHSSTTNRSPVKNLSAGDSTGDCVVWIEDPNSDEVYAITINFNYNKLIRDKCKVD